MKFKNTYSCLLRVSKYISTYILNNWNTQVLHVGYNTLDIHRDLSVLHKLSQIFLCYSCERYKLVCITYLKYMPDCQDPSSTVVMMKLQTEYNWRKIKLALQYMINIFTYYVQIFNGLCRQWQLILNPLPAYFHEIFKQYFYYETKNSNGSDTKFFCLVL